MSVTVSEYEPTDALVEWLERQWGEPTVEWHGEVFHPRELEGFVAHRDRAIGGVLTYVDYPDRLHIVSLDASQRRQGIGSILMARVFREAIARGKSRITLTVTNDNIHFIWSIESLADLTLKLKPVSATRLLPNPLPAQ